MKARKLLASVLAGAVVLGSMSFPVFAADPTTVMDGEELRAAVEAALLTPETEQIVLGADITVDGWGELTGTGVEIDGGGHKLTVTPEAGHSFLFRGVEKFRISNMTLENLGENHSISITSGSVKNVIFEGGNAAVMPGNGGVTITGCTFRTNGGTTWAAVYYEDNAMTGLVIDGCFFDCPRAVLLRGNTVMKNCTLTENSTSGITVSSDKVELTGNTFEQGSRVNFYTQPAVLSGNTFNGRIEVDNVPEGEVIRLAGNTVGDTAEIQEGYEDVIDMSDMDWSDGEVTVTNMAQLAQALSEAKLQDAAAQKTIHMLAGTYTATAETQFLSQASNLTLEGEGDATVLDLNGHTSWGPGFAVDGDNVTFKNFKITNTGAVVSDAIKFSDFDAAGPDGPDRPENVLIENVTVDLPNGKNGINMHHVASGTIRDCTITTSGFNAGISIANSDVTVEGTDITAEHYGIRFPHNANSPENYPAPANLTLGAGNTIEVTSSFMAADIYSEKAGFYEMTSTETPVYSMGNDSMFGFGTPDAETAAELFKVSRDGYADMYYGTLDKAMEVAQAGDTVTVAAGTYDENITIDKSITLKGQDGAVFSGIITIKAAGAALEDIVMHVERETLDGEAGNVLIEADNVRLTNCDFYGNYTDPDPADDSNGVIIGESFGMIRNSQAWKNIVIDGCTIQTNTMGIFPGMEGGAITNSVFKPLDTGDTRKSLAFNSFFPANGLELSGNTFYGNRLLFVAGGQNITVTENKFYDFTSEVVIWNDEMDLSGNYWGENPDFSVLLGENDIAKTYYTGVTAEGKLFNEVAVPSADQGEVAKKVTFEQNGSKVKVFLEGENGEEIKNLVLANLQFTLEGADGLVITGFEAAGANWTYDSYANGQYVIRQKGEADGNADLSGMKIELGTLTIGGYGAGTLKAQAGPAVGYYTTGIAQRSEDDNNLLDVTETVGCDALDLTVAKDAANLTINLLFNHNLKAGNTAADNDITVTVLDMDGEVAETFAIGDGNYTEAGAELTAVINKDEKYTVVVEGAGYRTFRQDVLMDADKTMVIWNNYKDNAEEVVDGQTFNATFLAGDIVMDYTINKYDLSAAVSYFGQVKGEGNSKYNVKYDLNRDGVIDSYDVAMVLVSWGK